MNTRGLILKSLCAMFLLALLASCSMMDYDGPDCTTHRRVRFTYNRNMAFADAFPHEVKALTLYAFDQDGRCVYSRTAPTDDIILRGYMDLDDLPAGIYDLQVWATGENRYDGSYTFGQCPLGSTLRDSLTVFVNRADSGNIDHDLTPLYYGTCDNADFTDMQQENAVREVTVDLMKDTENFRIVLQNQSGQTLDPSEFRFTITDNNGSLAADNSLLPDDTLRYHAWSVINAEAGINTDSTTRAALAAPTTTAGDTRATINGLSTVIAELTTNRLMKSHNMRLHVNRVSDGKEIINLPLVDVCLLVKGNYNHNMSDQEYLDRQDTWNLIFFLDNDRNWLAASIYVQSWRVVLQNADLGR